MEMICGKTRLIGLIGQPVSHSLSPSMHNAALKEMGIDWCYLAMPCSTENLELAIKGLKSLNCQGLNLTIPHKQTAMNFCEELSPLAKRLGAINTLVLNENGGWTGMNTDVQGFLAPLLENHWNGNSAVVLGCGGSARAVVAGLQDLHIQEITVVGRNKNKLKRFLEDLTCRNSELFEESAALKGLLSEDIELVKQIKNADLIVNTTPVGMSGQTQQSAEMPLGKEIWQNLNSEVTLYDLIYTPRPSPWLAWGAKNCLRQIDGLEMLIQQGAASLRLWTKERNVPIDVMRLAAQKELNS